MDLVVESVTDDQKVKYVHLLLNVPGIHQHRDELTDLDVTVRRHAQQSKR